MPCCGPQQKTGKRNDSREECGIPFPEAARPTSFPVWGPDIAGPTCRVVVVVCRSVSSSWTETGSSPNKRYPYHHDRIATGGKKRSGLQTGRAVVGSLGAEKRSKSPRADPMKMRSNKTHPDYENGILCCAWLSEHWEMKAYRGQAGEGLSTWCSLLLLISLLGAMGSSTWQI